MKLEPCALSWSKCSGADSPANLVLSLLSCCLSQISLDTHQSSFLFHTLARGQFRCGYGFSVSDPVEDIWPALHNKIS